MRGWISIDKPFASAALLNRTCDYVALDGDTATDIFWYRDIVSGSQIALPNAVKFLWSSQPSSPIPYPDYLIDPQTFNPPLENVVYKIEVTDSFNCVSSASFPYESIHVKADFTIDPNNGEAPLEVVFTDNSIRGLTYKWDFGDGSDTTIKDPPPHIYYKPGTYSALLTIESSLNCIDSMRIDNIVVDPSKLDVPNIFTPDGDNYNDFFRVEKKSLRMLSIEIFSRSGLKVYSFRGEGEELSSWEGWDGTVNNSSVKAAPGIYYYIIRAYGWDDIDYEDKKYSGFLYLYR
jgi:gliding motility-associated-like protein